MTRSSGEAGVRVLKDATNTERRPVSTGIPACVTSPPKTRAVPSGGARTVFFESLDSPVVRWDKPAPFPTPLHAQPDLSYGASFLLFDNILF